MKNHPDFVQLWCAKLSSHYWAEVHISHRVIVFILGSVHCLREGGGKSGGGGLVTFDNSFNFGKKNVFVFQFFNVFVFGSPKIKSIQIVGDTDISQHYQKDWLFTINSYSFLSKFLVGPTCRVGWDRKKPHLPGAR